MAWKALDCDGQKASQMTIRGLVSWRQHNADRGVVTSRGAEAFKAAIRRSLLLIVLLVVVGIVAVNVLKQYEGSRYDASARVLISTQPLVQIIAGTVSGTTPPFVDPTRIMADARALAGSGDVYRHAARATGDSPSALKDATNVSGGADDDLLTFTASSDDAKGAIAVANAVADAYVAYRAAINSREISGQTIRLRAKLAGLQPSDSARREIQALLNKLDALASLTSSDAKVVQTASSATKTTPAPVKDSFLGFSLGLVIGLLVAAVREAVDTRIRSEEDVEDLLAMPLIATLPTLPRSTRLVTYGRHEPAFADTYALLAANIAQSRATAAHSVLAVTSAGASEGKTATAANLAVSLARRGTSVILCDFDFRNAALADLFGVPDTAPGVLQILAGAGSVQDSLWLVALGRKQPRISPNGAKPPTDDLAEDEVAPGASLHLLPAGGTAKASAIHTPAASTLLADLRHRVDFVVLDTPPALLAVEMAELARRLDYVLIVVRHGRATQRSLRLLGRQARSWSAPSAAAILTDVPETQSPYYGRR
jgi:Mrp family chromosome partitioning ATPase